MAFLAFCPESWRRRYSRLITVSPSTSSGVSAVLRARSLRCCLVGRRRHSRSSTSWSTPRDIPRQSTRTKHTDLPPVDYPTIMNRFARHGLTGLAATNGLDEEENRTLLTTRNLDIAAHLVMSGLSRIWKPVPERRTP